LFGDSIEYVQGFRRSFSNVSSVNCVCLSKSYLTATAQKEYISIEFVEVLGSKK